MPSKGAAEEPQEPEPKQEAPAERAQGGKARRGQALAATAGKHVPDRDVQEADLAARGHRVVPGDVEEDRGEEDQTRNPEEAAADPVEVVGEEAGDHEGVHPVESEVAGHAKLEELHDHEDHAVQREERAQNESFCTNTNH
ncbi:hypothetical protein COOONC_11038 [Cooperia oncophora]